MENVAVAASRQNARATTSSRDVFCLSRSNNIRNYSVALLVRENHLRIQDWNKMIQLTIEAGLVEKWSFARRDSAKNDSDVVVRSLAVQHFYGGLVICALFLLAAIIAFILELIIHKQLKSGNPHRFWRTADWIIDGRRHMLRSHRVNNQKERMHQLPVRKYCNRMRNIQLRKPLVAIWRQPQI